MLNFFVAVEGTNFGSTITDTDDLSTIRGSSILLNETVANLSLKLEGMEKVSVGGSAGIWLCSGNSLSEIEDAVSRQLKAGPAVHLSFATAILPVEETDFIIQKAALQQLLRRRQLEQSTCQYPERSSSEICPIDFIRPTSGEAIWVKGKRRKVSASVAARRKHGVEMKQAFISAFADCAPDRLRPFFMRNSDAAPFALLLSSISEQAKPPQYLRHNLHDKIAVIHIDGNGFGKKQEDFVSGSSSLDQQIARQTKFDVRLRKMRASLVQSLLKILDEQGGIGPPSSDEVKLRNKRNDEYPQRQAFRTDEVIRMEMLLWGGDELTFVLPARLGWQAATAFMDTISDTWKIDDVALSASIGLVFCHQDAPIARIRELADNLASSLKNFVGREATSLFPVALESFDHIGDEIDAYLGRKLSLLNQNERQQFFALSTAEANALQCLAIALHERADFSRSRLRALAQAAHTQQSYNLDQSMLAYIESKLGDDVLEKVGDENDRARVWMLLEEFWDFLVPCPTMSAYDTAEDVGLGTKA